MLIFYIIILAIVLYTSIRSMKNNFQQLTMLAVFLWTLMQFVTISLITLVWVVIFPHLLNLEETNVVSWITLLLVLISANGAVKFIEYLMKKIYSFSQADTLNQDV